MSFAAAQEEILGVFARIQDEWDDYTLTVELDNRTVVDQSLQQVPYLQAQIVPLQGEQLDLGADPTTKQAGQILLVACAREGTGTLEATRLVEFAARYFHLKDFTYVRCRAAEQVKGRLVGGWWHQPVVINFWYLWK